ncbi:MAG: glycosyltransferase family 2 protein [Selenomonadaceae bacterium]|nr:glycosyltransferase family 2 protein [Selenomonadaceae bacterium]MBQ9497926.1 glycosyltransferase family 2 protein [Selenomonadaceae bacterium]
MSEVFNSEIQTPSRFTLPRVSVVIPMYNTEKFVGECLDSLLAQTFQNFEVIVVDDCSTDSSCAIVESYAEKFGGRLKLAHLEKNSGSGALPRNKGLKLSRGEYIFFMDADDMLKPLALEELYVLAKKFDADIVYCEIYYAGNFATKKFQTVTWQKGGIENEPTLEPKDLKERVQRILDGKYWVTPWCKFVRRDLMMEHEIFFPQISIGEDDIWTYGLVFYAENFLRLPDAVYFYRANEKGVWQKNKTPEEQIIFWTNPILLALKTLDNLMGDLEFFQKNLRCRYAVLEKFITSKILDPYINKWHYLPPFEIYETIKKEFGAKFGEHDVLVCALCTYAMNLQKNYYESVQNFNRFAEQAQQRITQLEAELAKKN